MKPKPRDLLNYESLKTAFENMTLARGKPVPKKTIDHYASSLSFFIEFNNSREGSSVTWNPDLFIAEAREDVKKAQLKIVNFYQWLQGQLVQGYKSNTHKVSESTARQRAYSAIRGFYSNNDIMFPKSFKCPEIKAPKATQADQTVPFFRLDERNGKFILDRSLLKHFLSNMKLRDQAIALSLLSTSQDGGDLFSLNVGWARAQVDMWKLREEKGENVDKRFYWNGNRSKTSVEFKVFFTKEATEFIRRYLEQERADAKDDEPLFVTTGNGEEGSGRVQKRMEPRHISDIFRDIAERMGIKNGSKYQNPLRPKRLRHIFRTACTHAGIDEGYIHAFMGHKSSISQIYLEKPDQVLEIEYSQVEPLLTVFGVAESESLRTLEQQLTEERAKRAQLQDKVEKQDERIKQLEEHIEKILSRFEELAS